MLVWVEFLYFILRLDGAGPHLKANVLDQPQGYLDLHPEKIFNVRKMPYKQFEN